MADADDRERTESPTQKRLDDARTKGQVPRSRDLNAAAVILAGGLGLMTLGSVIGGRLLAVMRDGLSLSNPEVFDGGHVGAAHEGVRAESSSTITELDSFDMDCLRAAGVVPHLRALGLGFFQSIFAGVGQRNRGLWNRVAGDYVEGAESRRQQRNWLGQLHRSLRQHGGRA